VYGYMGVVLAHLYSNLAVFEVHATEFIQPEVVDGRRGGHKVVCLQRRVGLRDGVREPRHDPAIRDFRGDGSRVGLVLRANLLHDQPNGIPDLVAEGAVAVDLHHVEVDVLAGACLYGV